MTQYDKIIDYIIEQADRYDLKNLQFEDDIKFNIQRLTNQYHNKIINQVITDITSVLSMQQLMTSINNVYHKYLNECRYIIFDKYITYFNIAYDNMGDLIDMGNELMGKFNQGLKEQKSNKEYDEETIRYIEEHALEQISGYSYNKIENIRSALGDLFLKGKANKANVRNMIEKILGTNKSKAEEIAQTELSRAYNYGTLKRLQEYQQLTGHRIKKYWHGFKYSERTCEDCKAHIGEIFDIDDNTYELPLHPRCRCVWLPILDGWDKPISTNLLSRANMLNTGYSSDMMYQRINNRLGINYAKYMSDTAKIDYLSGDRTSKIYDELSKAKTEYIKNTISSFDIAKDNSRQHMAYEYNIQMQFWKKYVANAMADNDLDILNRSYQAIQGLIVLPWTAEQLDGWNKLLDIINNFK